MALKATIYKATIELSDMDRHIYQSLNLTLAQHPSENDQRMMIRLLAFIHNYHQDLQFTKGLCVDDEPEIWQRNYSDEIELWIDLGLVDEKRIKKACGRAKQVVIYSYGGGAADLWWQKNRSKLTRFKHLSIYHLPEQGCNEMAELVKRTMALHCTIDNGEIWLTDGQLSLTLVPQQLYP